MLKKINRISHNKDFDRVFKIGQSFYEKALGFKAAENSLNITRFGILINAKVSKKAVVRNRIKRQIREIIQAELPEIKDGYDLVVIVFPQILDKNFKEIRKFLENGFRKLNLYK